MLCFTKKNVVSFDEKEYRERETAAKKLGYKTVEGLTVAAVTDLFRKLAIEKTEVTISLPKKLYKLVNDKKGKLMNEYLTNSLSNTIIADVDAGVFGDNINIIEEYDLKDELPYFQNH